MPLVTMPNRVAIARPAYIPDTPSSNYLDALTRHQAARAEERTQGTNPHTGREQTRGELTPAAIALLTEKLTKTAKVRTVDRIRADARVYRKVTLELDTMAAGLRAVDAARI